MGIAPSKEILKSVADNFQDSINHTLDDLMNGDKSTQEELAAGYREAHLLADGAAVLPVSSLKTASIDVNDLVMDGDPYSGQDVLARFSELGFRTEGGRIFYDHPRIGEEKPAPQPAQKPSRADEMRFYLEINFVSDVMESKNLEAFEDSLVEYNSQNEYNQTDRSYTPAPVGLADIRSLSVSAVFEGDDNARRYYKLNDFTAKLTELGFVVNRDRLEGHSTTLPAPKPPKPNPL